MSETTAQGPVDATVRGMGWYGLKDGFVATRAFATREELDTWNTLLVSECGIGVDFLSVGPNPINVDATKSPNEWISDVADAWNNAGILRSYLLDVQHDKKTGTRFKLQSAFDKQMHFDLTVAEELLIQRVAELTLTPP